MGLVNDLRTAVGDRQVLTDRAQLESFTTDWTRRFSGLATAVVRPADTEQVARIVGLCASHDVPVLAQGGNTGLVGGSVPNPLAPAPVVVSMKRLDWLGEVDEQSGQVTVGAGATLAQVQRHAMAAGWQYGVDIACRESATIGGTVATNAGGIRVCAYGMTRNQVAGAQAVLADGSTIEHLSGIAKNNTGYDWSSLLVGSEGTLGVITAVRLRLLRPVAQTRVALVGVRDYAEALRTVASVRSVGQLLAAEIMDRRGTELAGALAGLPWPLETADWPHVLLVEVSGTQLHLPPDSDAVVAIDAHDAARLWTYREAQPQATSTLGLIHKLDVSVPLDRLQRFADDLRIMLEADPSVEESIVFGHVADGNLHVEIVGPGPADMRVDAAVLALAALHGGSISGEHGIGRAKAAYLQLSRSAGEIAVMRSIKSALDPQGILAPGVIFGPA